MSVKRFMKELAAKETEAPRASAVLASGLGPPERMALAGFAVISVGSAVATLRAAR